ncbi:MAG: hypothetical protein HY514_02075 [Candidatus Aenigmarchaeota archaeon]|nr:hypothetical protein [Candidatus Aenigmarchaeota archaeon]
MQKRYILLLVVIVVAIFVYTGNRGVEQAISIDACSARFSTQPVVVTSDLCVSGKTCTAQPYDQQNNAVVDVLLCACEKAKAGNYADTQLNERIQSLVSGFYGYAVTAQSLCDQPVILTRRNYG